LRRNGFMKKKLLAWSAGRKNGNTEILVKEALMGAEEIGVDVELIRVNDLDIKHCIACHPCPAMKGPDRCVWKDDAQFLMEKVLDADGLLIGAPVYSNTAPGYLSVIRDRLFGPKFDPTLRVMAEKTDDPLVLRLIADSWNDERIYKKRVAAYISVGGAKDTNWTSLGLPTLHMLTFSNDIQVVDQMDVTRCAEPGSVLLKEDIVARARRLGQNLAKAMLMPHDEVKWMGEEPEECCPVCHRNLLVIEKGAAQAECAICGIKGEIKFKDGGFDIEFSEEQQNVARMRMGGKLLHGSEIFEVAAAFKPLAHLVPERMEKYKAYNSCIVTPPSKLKSNQ
jgi:multimeric flavodoxin WrbA